MLRYNNDFFTAKTITFDKEDVRNAEYSGEFPYTNDIFIYEKNPKQKFEYEVCTSAGTGCVICAVYKDNYGTHYYPHTEDLNPGGWMKIYDDSSGVNQKITPLYNGDKFLLEIYDSSLYDDKQITYNFLRPGILKKDFGNKYEIELTLYQGNPSVISSLSDDNGKVDISKITYDSGALLFDQKMCSGRVVNSGSQLHVEKGLDILPAFYSSGILLGGAEIRINEKKDVIKSYDKETGKIELCGVGDINTYSVKKNDKYEIYTSYIRQNGSFVLRPQIPDIETYYYSLRYPYLKTIVCADYKEVPVKWYRWHCGNLKSEKIYSGKLSYDGFTLSDLVINKDNVYVEICNTEDEINIKQLKVNCTEIPDDKIYKCYATAMKGSIKCYLSHRYNDMYDYTEFSAYSGERTVSHKKDSFSSSTLYDFGQSGSNSYIYDVYFCILKKSEVYEEYKSPTIYYKSTVTNEYVADNGFSLRQLKIINNHTYNPENKSITFYTPDSNTDVKTNVGINVLDNGRQPQIIKSDKDYEEGNCTVDLLEYKDGEIVDNTDRIKLWQDILKSDSPYLLKTPKGECFIVAISDAGGRTYNSETGLTTLTFGWKEIDKFDECIITYGSYY